MEADTNSDSVAAEEVAAEVEEEVAEAEDEALLGRAQELISMISEAEANPNARHLHALASILETEESRYVKESGNSSLTSARASHSIGRLGNLVRENDDFFELVSCKFLSDSRYSNDVRSAAGRLLLSCSSTSVYPHIFDDDVLENIKNWAMDSNSSKSSSDGIDWKQELGGNKPMDSEMLTTYATGLLAISLSGGPQVVENVLQSGLSAKLMHYLRIRILGDASVNQTDMSTQADNKHPITTPGRIREENKSRLRQVHDAPRLDEGLSNDYGGNWERNSSIIQSHEDEAWGDDVDPMNSDEAIVEGAGITHEEWNTKDLTDGKLKIGDADENARDGSSRRRVNRVMSRSRGKGRVADNSLENERMITSPTGRGSKNKFEMRNDDVKRTLNMKTNQGKIGHDSSTDLEENDERLKGCIIGSKDISSIVKEAARAAETEARTANAPEEAIKAAGDAAAELVRTAAFEVWKDTNDENAAVSAAAKAASSVADAAMSTEISRSASPANKESKEIKSAESEKNEDLKELFILDVEPLAKLREKYSIQCLIVLGEYVEALGPVLHEKGVDVSLAFLQHYSKSEDTADSPSLLPEVLKLICALAAHRKFAALFVDRGGMQKLLSVQRNSQTFFGLSSCLFTIGSLQGIMERVCALPTKVVHQVVELALQLIACCQDQARKNAAIFLAGSFVFRAILDAFDAQDGLQKMLSILQSAASVRSGGNSGALNGNLRNDRSPGDVLTSSEKVLAYHTGVALRQYFRAHLLLFVDTLRPNKSNRSAARGTSSARAAYKPLDISNEAMDSVFLQIQRDRKLGPALVRARWPVVDKFLAANGHITMLELCQAPPVERYLHDLGQYALGVLHIVTFVPYSRKLIVNASLSNDRVGMAVILDAANSVGYVNLELIHPALNLLVNLVCPPPSISNKSSLPSQNQGNQTLLQASGAASENRLPLPNQNENTTGSNTPNPGANAQTNSSSVSSGVVGERRITLGSGAGCAGLAAQLEQGYHQAREAVRANNGIKVLLHLLHPRMITPPQALDCLRALACRILLGLARDETIAHILTKLQVGKKLSELIRDSGGQAASAEQGKWQAELAQVAIELIAIVTNSGRASSLAATDAAAPTLRRIERAAIAAATPITYHSKELLLLIHEHLQASGLQSTADLLQKEAGLTPLPPLSSRQPPLHQTSVTESFTTELSWPSGRVPGFFSDNTKSNPQDEDTVIKSNLTFSSRKKPLIFASKCTEVTVPRMLTSTTDVLENSSVSGIEPNEDTDPLIKTPLVLPMKRKNMDSKESGSFRAKRLALTDPQSQLPLFQTPNNTQKINLLTDANTGFLSPVPRATFGLCNNPDDLQCQNTPGAPIDQQPANNDRMTLDSLVVQYLKHQHRQCPVPITTLPPLSLLHQHTCPEPSRTLHAPTNVTARVTTRELHKEYGGIHARRRDRQFVYSRFRAFRTCRDDGALLTCLTFLGDTWQIATGSHSGDLKLFDLNTGNVLESHLCHQWPVSVIESASSNGTQMILSSTVYDVKLWDASALSTGPSHSFEGCKYARFNHSGSMFAALSTEASRREVLLYDVQTCNVESKLFESSSGAPAKGHAQPIIHFSPLDMMLLWNGVLWDRRTSIPVHRFDQFTDYGGGGFHPAGNEVIINSEVWDLRKFKLLRNVPSLDQTVITWNGGGDVIYAILRRHLEDITSAVNTRRARHPLFAAVRTIDAVNYSDIATFPVDRCVLDFATEPTDSYVGVVTMDDHDEMYSSARLYEIGRRRPTDDDSDPDDGPDTDDEEDEEDEDDDSDGDVDPILGDESFLDDSSNDDEDHDDDDEVESGDETINGGDFEDDGDMLLDIMDGDDSEGSDESYSSGDDDDDDDDGDFDGDGLFY